LDDEPRYLGMRAQTLLKMGSIALLFCLLFWPNLRRLWDKTNPFTGEPNWGHAPFVPLVGLYYLFINRETLPWNRRPGKRKCGARAATDPPS